MKSAGAWEVICGRSGCRFRLANEECLAEIVWSSCRLLGAGPVIRADGKVVVECPRGGIEVVAGLVVVVVGLGAVSMS